MSAISDALAGRSGQGLSSILAQLNTLLTPTEQLPGTQSPYSVLLAQPGMVSRAAPMASAPAGSASQPSSIGSLLQGGQRLAQSLMGAPISATDAATWASGAPANNAVSSELGGTRNVVNDGTAAAVQAANDAALANSVGGGLSSLANFASGAPADAAVSSQLGNVANDGTAAAVQASNDAAINATDGGAAGAAAARASPWKAIAGDAGNALGIYNGIKQGGVVGDTSAALNAANLATRSGLLGGATGALGTAAGYGAPLLGIYSGIKQGGPLGYGEAALSTYGLASQLGLAPSISSLLAPAASAAAPAAASAPAATSAATGAGLGVGGATALGLAALPLALAAFVPTGENASWWQGLSNQINGTGQYANMSQQDRQFNQSAGAIELMSMLKQGEPTPYSSQQLTAMGITPKLIAEAFPTISSPSGTARGWLGGSARGLAPK